MVKNLVKVGFIPILLTLFVIYSKPAKAAISSQSGNIAVASATLTDKTYDPYINDKRVVALYDFLGKYDSPLVQHAQIFVRAADKYKLDWRLVVAISGVESTFGKQLPYNSNNAWGWGIFDKNTIYFSSYPEAIETISKSLREDYIDKWGAKNVYQIGRYYASSSTWAQRVVYFMGKIDETDPQAVAQNLPITL